jgi:MtN3 and saliva related transmembrane protein
MGFEHRSKNISHLDPVPLTGIAASVFTSLTLLPQLIKIIREKNAEGTSWLMLVILFIGLTLWIIYGVMKKDMIIVAANALSLVITVLTGILAARHRGGPAS